MDKQIRMQPLERNPKTHAQHEREAFWQITLPMVVGILLGLAALGAIILSATQPVTELRRWADTSLVWMILPSLFIAFVLLAILVGLVYVLHRILRAVPGIACRIQQFLDRGGGQVARLADLMTEPILRGQAFWAAAQKLASYAHKSAQRQNFSE